MRNRVRILLPLLLVATALPGLAEERYKKWIFEFSVGGYDPVDEVRSDAANRSTFFDDDGRVTISADPRPDSAESNVMQIDSTVRYDVRVGFGLAEWGWGELILDGGLGYIDSSISGFETAFQNCDEAFDQFCLTKLKFDKEGDARLVGLPWHVDFLQVGDLEQIPVSVNALVRFRPTKRLNPYGGIGVGYLLVDFEEAPAFTEVAEFLDRSRGQGVKIEGGKFVNGQVRDVRRPIVSAPDTFFYEARGGVEFQVNPRWSAYLDIRYEWANDSVELLFGDEPKLGRSTPNEETNIAWPFLGTPFLVTEPGPGGPSVYKQFPDGLGRWYANGGELDYGGFSVSLGARLAF